MVGFPGNRFSGEIVPEIVDLAEKGIIRVIDMVLVSKDGNGKLFITEVEDLEGDVGRAFEQIAETLRNGSMKATLKLLLQSCQTIVPLGYCYTRTFGPSN